MDDLISRQAVIDVCDYAIDLWHGQLGEGIVIAVKKKIEELPSAQPESEERKAESAQNVPKEDLISRKAAIEAMSESLKRVFPEHRQIAEKCLKALPSAQPEPHYCRECKWSRCHINVDKYGNTETYWHCLNWDGGTDEEGYCYEWERRTDG